jgi:ABC-type uncharacterized transport system fused permease/ATPase subunit
MAFLCGRVGLQSSTACWGRDFRRYITISHRPTLKAFHNRILTIGERSFLGEEEQNYTLRDIDHSVEDAQKVTFSSKATLAPTVTTGASGNATLKRHLKTRSTLTRLVRLVQLGLPQSKALVNVSAIIASVMVQARMLVQLTTHGSGMMSSIFKQDKRSFLRNFAAGLALSAGCAVTEQISLFFQSRLEMAMRQGLSDNFRKRLMAHNTFYRITQLDGRISDVSQRLADDVRDFASTGSEITAEILKPLIELLLFCVKLRALVGTGATGALLTYLGVGALIIRLTLPNFQRMVTKEAEANGRYRAVHSRVRTHCESIAFFGGDEREKAVVDAEFKNVHENALHRLTTSLGFGLVNQAIVRETPMLVQWLLRNECAPLRLLVTSSQRNLGEDDAAGLLTGTANSTDRTKPWLPTKAKR